MNEDQYEEMATLYRLWLDEGVRAAGLLRGIFELFLLGGLGSLTPAQREWCERGLVIGGQALDSWHGPMEYLQLKAGRYAVRADIEARLLSALLADVAVTRPPGAGPVVFSTYDVLICANRYLRRAIVLLIAPQTAFYYTEDVAISALPSETPGTIMLEIRTGLRLDSEPELRRDRVFYSGSPLSVAELIIEQLGSKLEIERIEQGSRFRFAIPLWLGDQPRPAASDDV